MRARAGARRRKTLVVVFQRGACDGLNTVVPYGEDAYRRLRPTIAIPAPRGGGRDAALDLDGHFGLHPALEPLLPLWKEGSLAAVHAVGSPDATRSHFDAQDFMESGTPGRKSTDDGWMNRHLLRAAGRRGHAVPRRVADADAARARCRAGRRRWPWRASASFGLRGGSEGAGRARASRTCTTGDAGRLHGAAGQETFEAIEFLKKADPARYRPAAGAPYPRGRYGESLKQVAQLIKADVGRRGGVHRDRRLGPPRGRGRRAGPAGRSGCASSGRRWPRSAATSATACRTSCWSRSPSSAAPRARTATAAPTTATPASRS